MEHWLQSTCDSLVGAMIGDRDSLKWMQKPIRSVDLPDELESHKAVFEAIEFCSKNDIAPTPETLISVMKSQDIQDNEAQAYIEYFSQFDTPSKQHTVKSTSAILHSWLRDYQADQAFDKAVKVWNGSGSYEEKIRNVEDIISGIKTDEDRIYTYSQRELYDEFIAELQRLHENRQTKGEVGITLPWESTDAFFSRLKPREVSAFMAYTGWGKTMFCMDMAEHAAWRQTYPCDVVVLLLETDPVNIQKRQFAKKAMIPYTMLESGEIDIAEEKYAKVFDRFDKKYVQKNDTGRIHYVYIPEPTLSAVLSAMEIHARMINEQTPEREIYFLLDYLQKIQPTHSYEYQQKHNFYESCAERIAVKTRVLNAHTTIFAQENPDTGEVFGSKTLRQKSQILMSLKRFKLEGESNKDKPVIMRGKPAKDALKNDRFWHRKGQELSSIAEIHFEKVNDGAGFITHIQIETPMGIIIQNKKQIRELKQSGQLVTSRKSRA